MKRLVEVGTITLDNLKRRAARELILNKMSKETFDKICRQVDELIATIKKEVKV